MTTKTRIARLEKARRRGTGPVVVVWKDRDDADVYRVSSAIDSATITLEDARRQADGGHLVIVTYGRTDHD